MTGTIGKNNACYSKDDDAIYISEEYKKDPFIFAHELGHALDFSILHSLSTDPEFVRIWTEELEAYKVNSGDKEAGAIQYFTDATRSENSAREECVAEATAIISGYRKTEFANSLGTRSIILEQNFPKLIAYVGNAIENPTEYLKNKKNTPAANEGEFF